MSEDAARKRRAGFVDPLDFSLWDQVVTQRGILQVPGLRLRISPLRVGEKRLDCLLPVRRVQAHAADPTLLRVAVAC